MVPLFRTARGATIGYTDHPCAHVAIRGSTFQGCRTNAIITSIAGHDPSVNVIERNLLVFNHRYGIFPLCSGGAICNGGQLLLAKVTSGLTLRNNTIRDSACINCVNKMAAGIERDTLTHVRIEDNFIYNHSSAAMDVNPSNTLSDVMITRNTILMNTVGIDSSVAASGATVTANTVVPSTESTNFESSSEFPTAWTVWHNCAADSDWSAARYCVANDVLNGSCALRMQSTGVRSGCDWPGLYVRSPSRPVRSGDRIYIANFTRSGWATGTTSVHFFDASGAEIGTHFVNWVKRAWLFWPNPYIELAVPSGATSVRVRYSLTSPHAMVDQDLLRAVR